MTFRFILIITVFSFLANLAGARDYVRTYYDNGMISAEGWIEDNKKHGYWITYSATGVKTTAGNYSNDLASDYWYFYENNRVTKEGYFKNGAKNSWWTFYRTGGFKKIKKQFKDDLLTGYVLYYKSRMLTKVEEYQRNQRLGQWSSYRAFKKDHPDFSLTMLNNRIR